METIYVIVGQVGKEPFRETWIAGYHPDRAAAESCATKAADYAQDMAHEFIDRQMDLFAAPKEWLRRFRKYDPQLVQGLESDDPDIKGATFTNFHYTVEAIPPMSVEE